MASGIQQLAHELECRRFFTPRLSQDIQHFVLAVRRTSQMHPLSVDRSKDLVEVLVAI